MRYFVKKCTYCKHEKNECDFYLEQQKFFKDLKLSSIKSISINCAEFEPTAKCGDFIEFEMDGQCYKRQIIYASANNKTFFVLIAKNNKQKECFTKYFDNGGEKHYFITDYFYNSKKFMVGVVNYKFIKRVIRNQKINADRFFEINEASNNEPK